MKITLIIAEKENFKFKSKLLKLTKRKNNSNWCKDTSAKNKAVFGWMLNIYMYTWKEIKTQTIKSVRNE